MDENISGFISDNIPENGGEDAIVRVCGMVRETFGVKCDYAYTGGFDSPGYDVSCYAIAFIKKNGEIEFHTHQHEIY